MAMVKICGLTREEDIEYVNELMPEYVGFVFARSKRMVSPKEAAGLIRRLRKGIKKVGVFVDAREEFVLQAARDCDLDVVQLHGGEDSEYCKRMKEAGRRFGLEVWKSIPVSSALDSDKDISGGYRVKEPVSGEKKDGKMSGRCAGKIQGCKEQAVDFSRLEGIRADGILLDTICKEGFGGSGKRFDWNAAKGVSEKVFTILAGGISPDNVKEAIEMVCPHVIDVSSGVETGGIKDYGKIKKLIENARG